jgi:hypothetical protein
LFFLKVIPVEEIEEEENLNKSENGNINRITNTISQ